MDILKKISSVVGLAIFGGLLTASHASEKAEDRPAIVRTPQGGGINKGSVHSEAARPQFSEGFGPKGLRGIEREGLVFVPTSDDNDKAQTLALENAVKSYLNRKDLNDTTSLEEFVDAYPGGPWSASVNVTLGVHCYREGRFSEALDLLESAWETLKDSSDPEVRKASVAAAAELAALYSRLGRVKDLKALLDEVSGRPISGSATEKLRMAAQGLHAMLNHPEHSFKCGPYALRVIRDYLELDPKAHPSIEQKASTVDGIPLSEVQQLASEMGMDWVAAVRAPGAELPLPAVVHWKVGHYAAVLKRLDDGRLLVRDATFLNDFVIEPDVFDEEASGYYLVPSAALGDGVSALSVEIAATVLGKGAPTSQDDHDCPRPEKDCNGMAVYSFDFFKAGLVIEDIPVGYKPPFGPAINFHLTYNQRGQQVLDSSTSSFGPKWSLNWLSYIELDDGTGNIRAFLKDGRMERHTVAAMARGAAMAYKKHSCSHTQMVQIYLTPEAPPEYERHHADGTVETFGREVPGTPTSKILLTQITDPQGNSVSLTYDSSNRLVGVTDALGQTSTFYYENPTYPHLVTKISDPFVVGGQRRSATFQYDTSGRLIKITDVIGIESQFQYQDPVQTDFITRLTTPYGTTSFTTNPPVSYEADSYFVEVTDPLGRKERVEYRSVSNLPASDPSSELPQGTGVQIHNAYLYYGNTFYWDKKTYGHYPPNPETLANYDKAVIRKWMWDPTVDYRTTGVIGSIKRPFESRIWYQYPGQTIGYYGTSLGDNEQPSLIARRVSATETRIDRFQYNDKGLITQHIDTAGRTRVWEYDSAGVDLIAVKQKNGGNFETLLSLAYNPSDPPRLPHTLTDAAGQTTTLSWNARGQLETIVQPGSLSTSAQYNPAGYLTSLDGPLAGTSDTVSYTYDAYGRTRTTTAPGGYTLTYDYDVLDRPTLITYPDGSSEQFAYQRSSSEKILELTHYKDRENRWTLFGYNALGERVSSLDPLLQTTIYNWCYCGALQDLYDGEGNRTHWSYDIGGRLIKKRYADATEHLYTYDLAGRLSSVTDAKGQVKTYSYYPDGRLAGTVYTNSQHPTANVAYTYDAAYGRLSEMADGVGTTTYTYHPVDGSTFGAGTLHTQDGPFADDTIAYTYDVLGRLKTRTINGSANSVTIDAYNALGRVTSVTNPLGTFTHSYDPVMLALKTVTAPNGVVTSYDYLGAAADLRLGEIKHEHPSSGFFAKHTYNYTPSGYITNWGQAASGTQARQWSFDYDPVDQLKAATLKGVGGPASILEHQAWVYDRAGNRLSHQNGSRITQGIFNNLNQLVSETVGGKMRVHGKTDEASTVSVRSNSNAVVSAATDLSNHFTAWVDVDPGGNTITVEAKDVSPNTNTRTNTYQVNVEGRWVNTAYDLNGNTTEVSTNGTKATARAKQYDWDAENRLVKITYIDDSATEFQYDGHSRRVGQVEKDSGGTPVQEKVFIWEGLTLSEERDGGVVTRQYYPQGEKRGADKYFYGRDHLGSVRDVTDATGTLWRRYDYDAYGRTQRIDHLQGSSSNGGPRLIRAVSRMKHGSSDIPKDVELRLSQETGMGSEMRQAGASDLILTFDQPVSGFTGLAVGGGSAGTAISSGPSITIPITFTGDGEITVEFSEVAGSSGETEDVMLKYRTLQGDTNQDGLVDALDVAEWGYHAGDLDTVPQGAHTDVNRDWQVDNSDKGLIEGGLAGGFSSEDADFRYTGHYYHAKSGLYLAPFRAYNPTLGRWINRDPIGESGGMNVYGYVFNNPIKYIDPQGLTWGESIDMFLDWMKGGNNTHPKGWDANGPRQFGPDTNQTKDMMDAPGVKKARKFLDDKNNERKKQGKCPEGLTNFNPGFGLKGLFQAGLDPTEQFVGNYRVDIALNPDGSKTFTLTNTTSMTSFLYGLAPSWSRGPGGNMTQQYTWTE